MAEIVKSNIANALNSLSGVLGTADQIKMHNDTTAPNVATVLSYKQDSFDVDESLELQNNVLKVAQGGINTNHLSAIAVTKEKLNSNVADNSTIELDSSNGLQIKDKGVTSDKIADGAIHHTHIADGAVCENNLESEIVNKINGFNISQVCQTRDTVVFGSGFDRLEDLLNYNYYAAGVGGHLTFIPHFDNATAVAIDGEPWYRCLFEYEDKYLDWGNDPVGYDKKCATTHGLVIPTYCRYDEHHILFKFAGTDTESLECVNMIDAAIGHGYSTDFNRYFPTT